MKAAVLNSIGHIEIEERNIPEIKDNEVLIKIEYVGICGSDLHFFEKGAIGIAKIKEPRILGHELVGRVESIGANVENFKKGDNVTVEPGVPCKECIFCKRGKYNLCELAEKNFLATPWKDGAFVEYISYPKDYVYKLPEDFPKLRAVMIEPYVVGLQAVEKSGARYGQSAVVLGAGCIGIMTTIALKAHGINEIIVIDIINDRLKKAKDFGATHVINANEENAVNKVMELTSGAGADLVFEAAGNLITQQQTVEYLAKFGTITFIGFSSGEPFMFDVSTLMRKEGKVTGIFRYANQYEKAIKELILNPIELERLISHIFDFNDVQKAMEENVRNKGKIIKAVIKI